MGLTKINVHIHHALALESKELTEFKSKTYYPDSLLQLQEYRDSCLYSYCRYYLHHHQCDLMSGNF